MKVKIFNGSYSTFLENDINEFLEKNSIKILYIKQSSNLDKIIISIFYDDVNYEKK